MPSLLDVANDLHLQVPVPPKVHRPELTARVRKRRSCIDGRAYNPVQFTIPESILTARAYRPGWKVDKRYWVAGASVACGLHGDGTHGAADGAATGADLVAEFHVVEDDGDDASIFAPGVLFVDTNDHGDLFDPDPMSGTYNPMERADVNVKRLRPGQFVYAEIVSLGSAGTVVMTLVLVPVRSPVEIPDDPI